MSLLWKTVFRTTFFGMVISTCASNEIILEASKDTFGRSNERNKNNGASPHLLLTHSPSIISMVSFDLSSITNEIAKVELRFRQHNSVDVPINLVVAPMVHTANNTSWVEGSGVLGIRGRNATVGEATVTWRAFRDKPWELENGDTKIGLLDTKLWLTPVAKPAGLKWMENNWVKFPLDNVAIIEEIRKSDTKMVTYGIWGLSGKGLYLMSSKESAFAPELIITQNNSSE